MTGEILLQIVMAMIGALGFGLLFHISGSRLITIMLGAAVNWGVYLLAMQWYDNRVTAFLSLRWQRPHWPSCSRDCSKRLSSRCSCLCWCR